MKVALINVATNYDIEEPEGKKATASFPPLGILYLAAVLEQNGIEASVLDQPAMGYTVNQTVNWVEKEKPDVVGFSALASSGRMTNLLSSRIKERNPHITTLIGNHFATFNAERILANYHSIDIAIRGEAEETIVDLTRSLQRGTDLKLVTGLTFRDGDQIAVNPDRPPIKNLNTLPFPNRKLLQADYHCTIAGTLVAPKKFTSILSSRGCTFSCRFCNCTTISNNVWRARSAENTLEELKQLKSEGFKQLIFVDDNFTFNPARVIKLCKGIRKERIHMDWIAEGRVDVVSSEMFSEMVAAGLRVLYFGIENANQRMLDYYNKRITPEQAEKAVKTARKAGVDVIVGSFVIGARNETREEIQKTIDFAKRIPLDIPQFNILIANPGNDIWKEYTEQGLLNEESFWETGVNIPALGQGQLSLTELQQMLSKAFSQHFLRPRFLLKQGLRTIRSRYRMNVILNNAIHWTNIKNNLKEAA